MTDTSTPLKATLKAGGGYDAPWLTVDGENPDDLTFKLNAIAEGGVAQALIEAANVLKAANNLAPVLAGNAESAPQAAPAAPSGWGSSAPAQPSSPPQWAAQGAGKVCQCGTPAQYKEGVSKAGKAYKLWACPNQRNRNDGHMSDFIN